MTAESSAPLGERRAGESGRFGGLLAAAAGTALLPWLSRAVEFLLLSLGLGVAYAMAFVAVGAALSEATTPATRGLAMGGYSAAIYVGMGLASVGLGPVIATWGFPTGFALAGLAAALWRPYPVGEPRT